MSTMNSQVKDDLRAEIRLLVSKYAELEFQSRGFFPGQDLVPPSGKLIGQEELIHMVEASLDGWLTSGRFNQEFESKLAEFVGVKYALTVNSGSSANLIAFTALTSHKLGDKAVRPGDEVITVAAGFPTTVNPAVQFGAVPVFLDVDIRTHNIDVSRLNEALTPKTKAVMLAHCLGNPFNVSVVKKFCSDNGLWLVEDCCDALGATYGGKQVGTFGDIATLSFYPAHHITMGEGGAVLTNNGKLKKIAESFRDWGRDCYCPPGQDNTCNNRFCWTSAKLGGSLPDGYDHKYIYSHVGYNLKITDMQAACGLAQLAKVDDFIEKRRANFSYLKEGLHHLSDFFHIVESTSDSEPSWFGFPITLTDAARPRLDLIRYLDGRKIGTRLLFAGNLIRQPYFSRVNYRVVGDLVNTEATMNNTLWLGVQPSLGVEELNYVISSLDHYFQGGRSKKSANERS